MSDEFEELRVSNDAAPDGAELRRRLAEDGYVFFRGLQDRDRMLELRAEMLGAIQRAGWLVAGTDPTDGVADAGKRCTEGDPEYAAGYAEVYRLEAFHQSAHWPVVTQMVERLMGRPIMPLPQKVARIWFPQYTDHTTPVHQDFVHFQGSFDTLTCWAPVGDCPAELGGLAVLPGSHKVDRVLDHHFSLGAGGLSVDPAAHVDLDDVWHSTDFEMGDALFFPALTIHKALPNRTETELRVSLDNRYQAIGDTVAEHMLHPHEPCGLQWADVYTGWESDELQYYWQEVPNPTVPKDMRYDEQGLNEALALASAGNEDAMVRLRRIARREPDSPDGQRALAVLRHID